MNERAPQFVQNLVIRDYCQRNNFTYLLSATEYAINNSHLILNQIVNDDLKNCDGIVLYSLFQLPEDQKIRKKICKDVLNYRKQIHFALENLFINNKTTMEYIEEIWGIAINQASEFDILNIKQFQL